MGWAAFPGWTGGENRSGGDWANGIPRNLLTEAVAVGRVVVVPITTPISMLALGDWATTAVASEKAVSRYEVGNILVVCSLACRSSANLGWYASVHS